jgi:hypothetical protein
MEQNLTHDGATKRKPFVLRRIRVNLSHTA